MDNIKCARQGEILIKKKDDTSSTPWWATNSAYIKNDLVIREGEATGHKHELVEGECQLYEQGDTLYLKVLSDTAKLVHPEHKPILLTKGEYNITIQQEYDENGWRNIAD